MAEGELEKAFENLAEIMSTTEAELKEEITVIEQQIQELKDKVVELHGSKETLEKDKEALAEIIGRNFSPDSES